MVRSSASVPEHDGSAVVGIHHVEIYVANNHQAAHFYNTVLGFRTTGTWRSESGDRTSLAIERGDIRLLLTAPVTASSAVAEHVRLHGEGIKDIALTVRDADALFHDAVQHGARRVTPPVTMAGPAGELRLACIGTCGDLVHTLVDPSRWTGALLPGFVPAAATAPVSDTALDGIDHIALALSAGELDPWIQFYIEGLGFAETHQEQVSTEYSAMRSKVVQTANAAVRFPMLEPAAGRRKSQIDDYILYHEGPGAQHLALRSHDIVRSVAAMAGAIDFLATPAAYYDALPSRVGDVSSDIEMLQRYGILVDRDPTGLLLQVFTKPIGARPTLFLEVIERRGAAGFGSGNIRALFEAVERTQAL